MNVMNSLGKKEFIYDIFGVSCFIIASVTITVLTNASLTIVYK
jgi:hypothetical protein